MRPRSGLTGRDAPTETFQDRVPPVPAVGEETGSIAGRYGLGWGGVIALGVAVLALVAVLVVSWGSGGETSLPAEATPLPGDDLAEVDVVRADGPTDLPDTDLGQLAAPVHAVGAACDLTGRDFSPSSTYHVVTDEVTTEQGPTVCRAQPLPDGRLIGTVGWGTEDLSVGILDPRRLGNGPQPAPDGLDDVPALGSSVRVVGAVEDTGEALVTRSAEGAEGFEFGLVAMDLDTGEERGVLAPGDVGDPGSFIGAAQLRDGHLVVVTGEPSAMGPDVLAGLGRRGVEATRIWFGPVDGELAMVREPTPLPDGGEVVMRDLLPPRIVDGSDGPLVASFEHVVFDDVWQVVLSGPDGATRVAAEVGGAGERVRSTAEPRSPRSSLLGRGGTGTSFDAVGGQMLIAGTVVGDAADDPEGTATVLLLDLAEGTWSRLPVEATVATFVRSDR